MTEQQGVKIDKKRFKGTRLNRIYGINHWLYVLEYKFWKLTDAHCFHNNTFENIHGIKALNAKLFNQSLNTLLNGYFDEYIKIRNTYNFTAQDKNNSKVVSLKNLT